MFELISQGGAHGYELKRIALAKSAAADLDIDEQAALAG